MFFTMETLECSHSSWSYRASALVMVPAFWAGLQSLQRHWEVYLGAIQKITSEPKLVEITGHAAVPSVSSNYACLWLYFQIMSFLPTAPLLCIACGTSARSWHYWSLLQEMCRAVSLLLNNLNPLLEGTIPSLFCLLPRRDMKAVCLLFVAFAVSQFLV